MIKNIAFIILAAGRGERMGNPETPKPLQKLAGYPLLNYILKTLKQIEVDKNQLWIVVHHQEDQIRQAFPDYQFIRQKKLDGTAGAVRDGLAKIPAQFREIAVFQADDSIFYQPETIRKFLESFKVESSPMQLITLKKQLNSLGSVIRDQFGQTREIWPQSKCLAEGLKNQEVVCGAYVFDRLWLEQTIPKLKSQANREIGLPYLVEIAYQENKPARAFPLSNPLEWASINTPQELRRAERLVKNLPLGLDHLLVLNNNP